MEAIASTLGDSMSTTLDTIALEKLANNIRGCNNFLFDEGNGSRKNVKNSVCLLMTRKRKMPVVVEEDPAIRKAELAAKFAALKEANQRFMLSAGRPRYSMLWNLSDSSLSSCESEDDTGEEHRIVGRNRN